LSEGFLEWINSWRAVLFVLIIVLVIDGFLLYRHKTMTAPGSDGAAQGGNETPVAVEASTEMSGPEAPPPQTQPAPRPSVQEQESEAEYVARVGEIQEGSVEAFLSSDEKLLRPDSLTAAAVEDMEDNMVALRNYADQVEDLGPPEKYGDQHELLVAAVADLHGSSEIAYRLVTDPASATQSDYDTYDLLVDRAATGLQRSNEVLGEDYETILSGRKAISAAQ
jgi:hypothetical protein